MQARQRGVVMIVVVVSLLAVLAMAGLAIDVSHTLSTKARLQSVVDASALSAAKVLDQTGSTTAATAAAITSIDANKQSFAALRDSGITPIIEFADSAAPFTSGAGSARFVRVRIEALPVGASLVRVLGISALDVRASAVAGPSPPLDYVCNLLPIAVCATETSAPYGYEVGDVYALKSSNTGLGGGNYGLIDFDTGSIRENLAGGYNQCLEVGDELRTKSGNTAGPTAQGLNTRFNRYSGGGLNANDYPPDVVTREPSPTLSLEKKTGEIRQGGTTITSASQLDYNHAIYESQVAAGNYSHQPRPAGNGVFSRREVVVPIANCSTPRPVIQSFACFFLLQKVDQSQADIFGEFIEECEAGGRPGGGGGTGGPYIIELYRDTTSADS
jgi:hypothetical protein